MRRPAPRNVLVLCTGNSARSILGEVLFRDATAGRFRGYSAGSQPKEAPHPDALRLLAEKGHDTTGLASKSWDVFAAPDAPRMDIVITVCDSAASETCPYWPGAPVRAHWGLPDPAGVTDPAARARAFAETYRALAARIDRLMALPEDPGAAELQAALSAPGTDDCL
ncbi:arsenate reductase ArsC [Roseisalinus antarcticus]|uniref:Protein ArsC n=1 Tax=Roseisalinus antarcticus TaxID=254357 RepID=A0A1Y5T6Z6_9RHOB|nr:arsenate reductase ArsC [Roseisalinus antarcticus]SLN53959.1 Protein ArsC [Roseisalinus antarcticus]